MKCRTILKLFVTLVYINVGAQNDISPSHTNIVYGNAANEKLHLDIYEPKGDGPFPIAIYIHGGGWTVGDKANPDDAPAIEILQKAGFIAFSINYRLAPEHRWPSCLDDIKTAIRWVKANAVNYNGDPSTMVLAGYSAGGHLATFTATLVDESIAVKAVIGLAPLTDFVQELPKRGNILGRAQRGLLNRPQEITPESLGMLKAISPINYVRPGLPPFLLLHGDKDQSVPFEQSILFQKKLQDNGVQCDIITIPGAPHRLTEWNDFLPDYSGQIIKWLNKYITNK
ncbi:alpha/beta hydrolase [Aurantibacter crassamenti]|uniref:alpha/beta hydrolase n=1 Tax=Aurantibacter crassamenti TaxID=1837375 RepID=UPI00193A29D9|nr:alpha/beta hydrolase [Aurantibacter crassamenti]MBM1105852.1 alpha/beta hydrolase [Aurantibacter crassamenti]